MFKPKVLLLVMISVVVVSLLAGCPQPTEEPGPPPVSRPQLTTVKLWTIWNAEPRKSALAALVSDFEAANPGVRVKVTHLEPDAYKTRIRVALGGGEAPDIYFVWSGEKMLHNFVRGGRVADLTSYMDANGGQWRDRLIPASLDRVTFEGKVYGVPYLLQCTFFFYNRQMFEQHGWQVPVTYTELIQLCEKIKAAGIVPIALGNVQKWPAHHLPFVLTQRLMGKEASEAQYDPLGPGDYAAPAFVQALQMFSDFANMGFFNKSPNGTTRENARALFYSEQTAMFYTGTWDMARFSEGGESPEEFWDKWDFFNFPAVEGGQADQAALAGSPDGYVMSADSQVKDEAVEFLRFITSVEQARKFVSACQELVQVKGAVDEENAGPRLRKYAQIVAEAETITPWMDTMMERIVAEEYMNGVQALLGGTATPAEAMERVRQRQAAVKKRMLAGESAGHPGEG